MHMAIPMPSTLLCLITCSESAVHHASPSFPLISLPQPSVRAWAAIWSELACQCRPAASEGVMPHAASTAIPAHVEEMGDDHTRYLVSVKPALAPTHSSKLLGSRSSRRSSLLQTVRQPFDDVKLGPLLGKGGYGRVYRAVWNGAAVACKVVALYFMLLHIKCIVLYGTRSKRDLSEWTRLQAHVVSI